MPVGADHCTAEVSASVRQQNWQQAVLLVLSRKLTSAPPVWQRWLARLAWSRRIRQVVGDGLGVELGSRIGGARAFNSTTV